MQVLSLYKYRRGARGQKGWEGVTGQPGGKDSALGSGLVTGWTVGCSLDGDPITSEPLHPSSCSGRV